MLTFTQKLLDELDAQLNFIDQEDNSTIKKAELSFTLSKKVVDQLKAYIIKYTFKSTAEEIKFFKEIKPQFTSRLIYNLMLYNLETKKPKGGNKILRKYLMKELDKLKNYFDYNLDFYKYYRANANYLDHKYFVRNKHDIQLSLDGYIFEVDPRFGTTHDYKVAKILAHDLLQVHLEDELASRERKDTDNTLPEFPKSKLTWTDNKNSLIELIYALYTQGSVENGKIDIKELATYFESVFNIELGDYYRTYLEIRMRKTGRTKYIDALKDGLSKRMDDQDK